jgi:hypothetical protein
MDETQGKSTGKNPTKDLPKGGVRLKDLADKRAQNLRDNLSKRKQQSRARQDKLPVTE